ncbi:MAG TPA: hypothetical protein VIL20_09595 [Sandaracinaceae bacterium]
MMVLLSHLIRDGRYGRARVAELGRLLARFEAQPGRLLADPMARAMAERIVYLKRALAEAFAGLRACESCAKGCGGTSGFFEGGRCCGTATLDVFTQPEVRVMNLAGVVPPTRPAEDGDERAGCLFRGSTGCTVNVEQRPARCLVYVCHDLRIELEESGDGPRAERIHRLRRELEATFARFVELTEP